MLVTLGTVLGLAVCELGLRAYHTFDEARKLAAWRALEQPRLIPEDGVARLAHLIRPHVERRIVYELIPNLSVNFMGAPVTINADGFRGPAYGPARGSNTVRIVGLGDSVMFGWGVADGRCFLRLLEARLNAAHPGTTFEVINTAVPGYNTVMQVETLAAKGLGYEPDIVVIDFVGNDLALPNIIARSTNHWDPSRLYLLGALRSRAGGEKAQYRPFEPAPRQGMYQPEAVPAEYADMVGIAAFRKAMRELVDLGREHEFDVVVSTHLDSELLRETCRELELPLVELLPRLQRHMQAHGIEELSGSELTLSDTDPHPSALAHEFQAEELERLLTDEGILERAIERRR